MKIIPLLLLLGATPVLAQGTKPAPTPAATPAKASKAKSRTKAKAGESTKAKAAEAAKAEEKTADKVEGEKQSRRQRRVSRRPARAPRPVVSQETEAVARKDEKKPQKAASAKPEQAKAAPVRTAKAAPKARAAATGAPEEVVEKKKRGGPFSFLGKIFGGGKKAEQSAGEKTVMVGPPAPTPAPAPRQQRGRVSASPQDVEPVEYEAPLPSYQRQPQAPPVAVHRTVTNARGEMVSLDDDSDLPSAEPYVAPQRSLPPQPRQLQQAAPPAPASQAAAVAVASTFDRTRYQETRRKAAEDPEVASLGEKLNATTPGDAAHGPAARAYTIALFGKMRDLDPEQADWITRMEAATIRRIDAGKPVFAE